MEHPSLPDELTPTGSPLPKSASFLAALADPHLSKSLQGAAPKRSYQDPQSPSNTARIMFEKLVKRYYYQLTTGCGFSNCNHKLCASCKLGPRLSLDAASIMSVQLASRPRQFFCPRIPPDLPLSVTLPESILASSNHSPSQTPRQSTLRDQAPQALHIGTSSAASAQSTSTSIPAPSRPFLYSLLSSSPFASLFQSDATVGPATGQRGDDSLRLHRSYSEDGITSPTAVTAPESHLLADSDDAQPPILSPTIEIPKNPASRASEGGGSFSSFKSKSLMDLPNILSQSVSFAFRNPFTHFDSGYPSRSMSPSQSVTSFSDDESEGGRSRTSSAHAIPSQTMSQRSTKGKGRWSPNGDQYSGDEYNSDDEVQLSLRYLTYDLLKSAVATYNPSIGTSAHTNSATQAPAVIPVPEVVYASAEHEPVFLNDEDLQTQHDAGSPSLNDGESEPKAAKMLGNTADPRFLLNTLRTVFSSSEALNKSFLYDSSDTRKDKNPSGLDVDSIRLSYQLILSLPKEIFLRTFVDSIEILLAKLHMNVKRLSTVPPLFLRQLLILLENPLLDDPYYHESLLRKLALIIGGLRSKARSHLIEWLCEYDAVGFFRLVKIFQTYLTNHFYPVSRSSSSSGVPDEGLVCAVKVLSLLYHANEAKVWLRRDGALKRVAHGCIEPIISISAFYNEPIGQRLNFKEEYRIWRRTLDQKPKPSVSAMKADYKPTEGPARPSASSHQTTLKNRPQSALTSGLLMSQMKQGEGTNTSSSSANPVREFSWFNFPFLFDPVSKTRILHIDAMVQMSREFEDAFANQAFVLHATKFLQEGVAASEGPSGSHGGNSEGSSAVANLELGFKHITNPYLILEVRREKLVKDVLDQVQKKRNDLKKPLKVKFVGGGEEGMDQGGVQKEFFQVLVSQLLDPSYGMFVYDEETRFCWFNRASLEPEQQFELVGTIIGLAIYNGVILNVSFPSVLYKKILNEPITLEDMKSSFPSLGRGLQQLLDWDDGDVGDIFMRTFEISYEVYGQVKSFPLVAGGDNILVTNENRFQYVELYIQHYLFESVKRPFQSFKRGLDRVVGGDALLMCRSEELELLVCGIETGELEFGELEKGAEYDDGYGPDHQVIKWFWSIVHNMSIERKKMLLNFVTASDRVPLKGLGQLTFVIQRNGPDSERLPTALTCFGRLLLPEYSSAEKLENRLITAIENAKGFGLV